MAVVQAAVFTFPAKSVGSGTQVLTGLVVDRAGVAFTPSLIMFQSGFTAQDTLTGPGYPNNYMCDERGVATPTTGTSTAVACNSEFVGLNLKICSAYDGSRYCVLGVSADAFFGGTPKRAAYVSAVSVGGFTLTYDLNDWTGDDIIAIAIGGAGLTVSTFVVENGVHATDPDPVGLIAMSLARDLSGTPSAATGAGGGIGSGWGWTAKDSGSGAMHTVVVQQAGNRRYQRTDTCRLDIDPATGLPLFGQPTVSDWGVSSVTVAGGTGALDRALVFCGTDVRAAAGSISLPAAESNISWNTGVSNALVVLVSAGQATEPDVVSDRAELAIGFLTEDAQSSFWTGEDRSGNVTPLHGARYLSSTTALRFATPAGLSTTFSVVATATEVAANGAVTLALSGSDGISREVLWFALGVEPTPTDAPCVTGPPAVACWNGGTPSVSLLN